MTVLFSWSPGQGAKPVDNRGREASTQPGSWAVAGAISQNASGGDIDPNDAGMEPLK